MTEFNLLGFGYQWDLARGGKGYVQPKSCPIHPGHILIPKKDKPGILFAASCCGSEYPDPDYKDEWNPTGDSQNFEQIKEKFKKQQTRIIQGKNRKKRYFDQQGNEINDEVLLADIARGAKVIFYKEEGGPDPKDKQKGKPDIRIVHK